MYLEAGVTFSMSCSPTGSALTDAGQAGEVLDRILAGFPDAEGIDYLEGPNEPNNWPITFGGAKDTKRSFQVVTAYMEALHATMRARPAEAAAPARGRGLAGAFATTFALTLTNPATILSFIAVFAGLGLVGGASAAGAMALVLGVFLGSALWWLGLTGTLSLAHGRVSPGVLVAINRVSGAGLALFGIAAIVSGLRGL